MVNNPGDSSKLELIYTKYRQLMWREANKILNDPLEAEDAVHIAFVEILKNLAKIDNPLSPQTRNFAAIVTRSRAINLYNKRKRHREVPFEEIESGTLGPRIISESLADKAELKEKVSLLDRLPTQYRDALYLRHNLGYDVKEIALLLGISKANAKKRITRAKTQLARLIKEWNGDE
jgi:RNA polymerase sigma-70 factor (ECF subfamily)